LKKLLTLALCVIGFILVAAPTAVEYHPVFINGKPFANAVVIQGGILAIPLEEFAKAVGAAVTLEPTLTLQGNRLSVREAASVALKYKEAGAPEKKIVQPNASAKIKLAPGQIFHVQHSGVISPGSANSPGIIIQGGKAFIPLDDVRRALGDGSVRSFTNLKPGDAIRLNFARNQNSIIAVLIGL